MSSGNVLHERTPLLPPIQEELQHGYPRFISDALTRISPASLDCLVPGDLLPNASETPASDFGFLLTSLLHYRQQKLKHQTPLELDLYGQWIQEKSLRSDVELLDKHIDTIWEQFLAHYRTNQEVDTVLWSEFRKDSSSCATLKAVDFLRAPNPPVGLLTHALVESAILRRWKQGAHYPSTQSSLSLLERSDTLGGSPRNLHFLALISHFIYLGLLAHFLLHPPNRVSTDLGSYTQAIGGYEAALFMFTISNLIFQPLMSCTPQCVVLLTLFLPFPGLPQPGDGFFDVLLLMFAFHIWGLHRPSAISPFFVFDLPKSLPLTIFVRQSIMSGLAPSLFSFGPAFIASVVLLSFSLDGNYLQAFIIPAPMETRSIFLTIVFVILLGVLFSIFATTVALPAPRSALNGKCWDRFGTDVGQQSRAIAISACSTFYKPYLYPPPFNLLHAIFIFPWICVATRSGRSWGWVKMFDVALWRITVLPFLLVVSRFLA